MPTGVVLWWDAKTGEGMIRRDGHEYPAASSEVEPAARVPLARVHFDVNRVGATKRAVNVTLRRGRRVSPRQHRFGDLAGAHHPDEKGHHPLTRDHPGTDWSFEGKPVQLVEAWVGLVNRQELSTARLLYAPQAVLHIGPDRVEGRDAVIDRLREELALAPIESTEIHERAGVVRLETRIGDRRLRIDFEVAHGRITEQRM